MNTAEVVVVFLILWWLVFFMTLPFGIQRLENPEPGHEIGAPERPRLLLKAAITTLVSGLLTVVIYFAADAGWLPIYEWLGPGEIDPTR